jgi:peptide deformylase
MAIRNILKDDDPGLMKKSRVVTDFNKRLHLLIDDMRETLIEANGLGLAAPQVGVLRRVALIVDINIETEFPEEQIIELINPEIINEAGEQTGSEGCLSVPGVYGIVTRPDTVRVRAQDRFGKVFEFEGSELTARAVCHECDHLNGVIFTSLAERILTEEELAEMAAERERIASEEEQTASDGERIIPDSSARQEEKGEDV